MNNEDRAWETMRIEEENERNYDHRSPYELDRTRVVHSFPFRRLQGKFQMISVTESDFNRNRLTHSLEVASLAKNIYLNLYKDKYNKKEKDKAPELFNETNLVESISLLETISLLHDIGNPPFGHAGEVALNCMMAKDCNFKDFKGFEGNAQCLHMLTKGNEFFAREKFNLTKRTLLGILKYPNNFTTLNNNHEPILPEKNRLVNHNNWKPPKCYYDSENEIVLNELLGVLREHEKYSFTYFEEDNEECNPPYNKTIYKTFDCSIMDIADDISNALHDLEDVIYLKKIQKDELVDYIRNNYDGNLENLDMTLRNIIDRRNDMEALENGNNNFRLMNVVDKLFDENAFKQALGLLVNLCVNSVVISENKSLDRCGQPVFRYYCHLDDSCYKLVKCLKDFVSKRIIKSDQVQTIVHGGMLMIMQIYEAYESNPEDLLSEKWYDKFTEVNDCDRKRIICNIIAGMTDEYAYRIHARLFGYNKRSMFEKI